MISFCFNFKYIFKIPYIINQEKKEKKEKKGKKDKKIGGKKVLYFYLYISYIDFIMAGTKYSNQKTKASNKKVTKKKTTRSTPRSKVIDWESLKYEWITTDASLSDIARKYELTFNQVRNAYQQGNWTEELKKYKNYQQEEWELVLRAKAQKTAHRIAELDEAVLTASERIIEIVQENLSKVKTVRDISKLKSISVATKIASEALKNSHYTIRLAGDKSTSIVEEKKEVTFMFDEEEKARIEKELGIIGETTTTQKELLS